jgi:sugar phosphate isomerase/epimerase
MQLGIFAKTFVRPNFQECLAAATGQGVDCVQFNFSCAGLPTLPGLLDPALVQSVRSELERRALSMAAVSGTCNLIHPEPGQRAKEVRNLAALIRACPDLGTSVVTLCTGTRDPGDMWRAHAENHSTDAWRDLENSLAALLPIAEEHGVVLGIEPEPANVIDSATRARKLLDEMKSPFLKIIFDAANLLRPETLPTQRKILSEAVELIGAETVVAHAKDLVSVPGSGHVAAGRGVLDYNFYLSLLKTVGFDGPLVLHSLSEKEVPAAVAFLKQGIESADSTALRR